MLSEEEAVDVTAYNNTTGKSTTAKSNLPKFNHYWKLLIEADVVSLLNSTQLAKLIDAMYQESQQASNANSLRAQLLNN